MDVIEAHDLIAQQRDRPSSLIRPAPGLDVAFDVYPLRRAIHASLSGWLPDCRTLEDVNEAADHGESLARAGVVSRRRWDRAAVRVSRQLLAAARADQGGAELEDHGGYVRLRGTVRGGVFYFRGLPTTGRQPSPDGPRGLVVYVSPGLRG